MKCRYVGCWNKAKVLIEHKTFSGRRHTMRVCEACAAEVRDAQRWDAEVSFVRWWLHEWVPVLVAEAQWRAAWADCSVLDVLKVEDE